jgi:divalent metal cation (Fe/Co/Zn/Cd) transporter
VILKGPLTHEANAYRTDFIDDQGRIIRLAQVSTEKWVIPPNRLQKCRIRKSGTGYFVELHVEVDGDASVAAGHVVGGKVRAALRAAPLRIADAFIHIEPFTGTVTPRIP